MGLTPSQAQSTGPRRTEPARYPPRARMDRSGRVTFSALIGASMSLCALACTPDSDSSSSDGGLEASEAGGGSAGLGGNDAGQGGSDEWQGLASYEDQFPPACGALTKLVEYLYEYKSCATDGDCTVAQSTCLETKEHCSGAFYANVQHDATTLQTLFDAASTCPHRHPCCPSLRPQSLCCGRLTNITDRLPRRARGRRLRLLRVRSCGTESTLRERSCLHSDLQVCQGRGLLRKARLRPRIARIPLQGRSRRRGRSEVSSCRSVSSGERGRPSQGMRRRVCGGDSSLS